MKCPQLLFVCWCSSILAVSSCFTVYGNSCVSAYWREIACELNITGDPVAPSNTTYSLKFTQTRGGHQISTCPLIFKKHTYSCVCTVLKTKKTFGQSHQFNVELCKNSSCLSLIKGFKPYEHIQLTPPDKVDVQQTPEVFNITWKSMYEGHWYIGNYLEYEVLLEKSPSGESKKLHTREKFLSVPRIQLEAHATYCTRVRSTVFELPEFTTNWSKWGPQMCWRNGVQEDSLSEQENIMITLTKFLVPVCVVVGVLVFVFHSPAARLRIKTLSHTPSPAPFFQPLFQQHEGNLKEWLSPQGKSALPYKTDEILINDAVTVEPKPRTEDPEENQDVHITAVTQLIFPQCPTSYVGLPGMQVAPQPITTAHPAGDTSYTRLPGSVWGCSMGQVQVTPPPPPPQHVFESSCADSGCSCDELTPSPECSLPNSPVEASSPPRYCKDYCILNKTAEGVVPVLVSR